MCRKDRDTSRGSPRSFAAQRTLAQDDIKLHHYRVLFIRDGTPARSLNRKGRKEGKVRKNREDHVFMGSATAEAMA
jgi:hypothetical protein